MFDRNLMKLPGMRAVMGALILLALLQGACIVGWAIGLSRALCVLWEGGGVDGVAVDLAQFAACFAALKLVRFAQETMLDRYALARARELRDELLARAFDASTLLSLRVGSARVASVANDGIDEVQTYLRIIPPKVVGMAAISVPLLAFEFAVDWPSGVILAVMFPVIIFFMVLLGRQARERSERQYAAYTRLTNRFMDTLRGLPVLKAFGAEREEGERVYRNSEQVRVATVRTLRTATLSSAVLDLIATFGVAAVAIMLAFRLMDGSISFYTGLVALVVAPEYFAPIRSFASDYHASLDGKNSLSAVLEMLGTTTGSRLFAKPGEDQARSAADPSDAGRGSDPVIMPGPAIRFDNVTYRYEDGTVGVEGIAFSARGSEKIGVVGKSGSGKSTLAGLFAGFIEPVSGHVTTSDGWRGQVRYIPQSPYIFRATLADNIRFYCPDIPRSDVEEAVRAVGLEGLVASLPDGLDTHVGEGARGLSGGEAHRVALARILVDREARVLVFDEPTAHLDIETERDLKPVMLAAMEGRLVLFATHRLHWVENMDRVIELDSGRIAGSGAWARDLRSGPRGEADANELDSEARQGVAE